MRVTARPSTPQQYLSQKVDALTGRQPGTPRLPGRKLGESWLWHVWCEHP